METVEVKTVAVERKVQVTGEFLPYQRVSVHARVNGYIERVLVDRGSFVRKGQLLAELSAPELTAQMAGARAKVLEAAAQRAEAEALLQASESRFDLLRKASQTPGAIAGNELIQAEKSVAAARASVNSAENARKAADAGVQAIDEMRKYLRVVAPFEGSITERFAHPGALVGPGSKEAAMFELQQLSRLRLVAAVPETNAGGIIRGARVTFTVPAYPGRSFTGVVARISRVLDTKTRTMAVELDVPNARGELAPGMFPDVTWPVRSARPGLLVPPTAIVTTTERTFVVRITGGRAEWVDVKRGSPSGDLVEIYGGVRAGDIVVKRATDEIRDGSMIKVK